MTLAVVGAGLDGPEKLEGLQEIYRMPKKQKEMLWRSAEALCLPGVPLHTFILEKRKYLGHGHELQAVCQKGKIK